MLTKSMTLDRVECWKEIHTMDLTSDKWFIYVMVLGEITPWGYFI